MRKKGLKSLIPILVMALVGALAVPSQKMLASEESGYEENYEETAEEETEEPIPESYYLPIESNQVKGWPAGPQIEAEAAVVMDADTGAFLYSKNMEAKEYPASITKIMTTLLALENGNLNDKITFSEYAVYSLEEGSSHAGIQPGEKMNLRRALYGLMLESANDIANGIAEHIGGSVDGFADMMNQKAEELGCVNTHFTNPHGLHNEEHYTCARDMALITKAAMENRMFRKIAKTRSYTCPETNKVDEKRYWLNHDKMLQEGEYAYEGCIGGKTGFTSDALNTLVTIARRDGRTLISVILRVNGANKAYDETAQILDYGFANFKNVAVSYPLANVTRAELLGMSTLGEIGCLNKGELEEKALEGDSRILVSIPGTASETDAAGVLGNDMKLVYSYNGWSVGGEQLKLSSLDYKVPLPDAAEIQRVEENRKNVKTGFEAVLEDVTQTAQKIPAYLLEEAPKWIEGAKDVWYELMDYIYDNDILAAVICFVIILILLPFLCLAFARNSKAKRIRKQRKREREERIKREEDIDRKSVKQIELELRQELLKDRERRAAAEKKEEKQDDTEADEKRG